MNGVIDGTDLVYREYYDISIAVATPKGLVVPVLRNVEDLDFAGVERVRAFIASALAALLFCKSILLGYNPLTSSTMHATWPSVERNYAVALTKANCLQGELLVLIIIVRTMHHHVRLA